jgi:hypothetical protein
VRCPSKRGAHINSTDPPCRRAPPCGGPDDPVVLDRLIPHVPSADGDQESFPRRLCRLFYAVRAPAGPRSLRRADPLCMARWSVLSLSIRYCGSSLEA